MTNTEQIELKYPTRTLPKEMAMQAGRRAYGYFLADTRPSLNPLTILSFSVRRYENKDIINSSIQKKLTDEGFIGYGLDIPVKSRLRLPGMIAVSMVVPDIEGGDIVGEYLEEPFLNHEVLGEWYQDLKKYPEEIGTPTAATTPFGQFSRI